MQLLKLLFVKRDKSSIMCSSQTETIILTKFVHKKYIQNHSN